jgi:hypothetical protein
VRGLLLRRLTPLNPRTKVPGMLCGISSPFGELFPIRGQITHVLRTRAPCAMPYCYGTRTRLACVKHAASVRSEPGSNSRLKLEAWAKKNALRFTPESQPAQANYCRSIYSDHSGSKSRMVSNGFWHIVSIVKEQDPPVQQKGVQTTNGVYVQALRMSILD